MKYYLRYRIHVSGKIHEASFESIIERNVFIQCIERYADIIKEWTE